MALPILSGKATLVAKEGVATRFAKSGLTVVDLNLKFSKSKKDDASGEWTEVGSLWVRATAFGDFAEYIANSYQHFDQVDVQVEVEQSEYTTQGGDVRHPVQGRLVSIGSPQRKRDGFKSGGQQQSQVSPAEDW